MINLSSVYSPDIFVSLYVDLVELGLFRFAGDIILHFHGNVAR